MRVSFVLNTHIPRSPRPWAYEALYNCYIPLFSEIKDYPITIALSPQLIYEYFSPNFKINANRFYEKIIKQCEMIENNRLRNYYIDYYREQHNKLIKLGYDIRKIFFSNQWEYLAYPSTHCVFPLVTEKLINFFIERGELAITECFGTRKFNSIWLPEMAFEDGANGEFEICAKRYRYLLVSSVAVKKHGTYNQIYKDESTGMIILVRNNNSQQYIWGDKCKIAGLPDFRETYSSDKYGNKIYRIGGGLYYPEDAINILDECVEEIYSKIVSEQGECCNLIFDTEYFGHHWWEGKYFLPKLLKKLGGIVKTCLDITSTEQHYPNLSRNFCGYYHSMHTKHHIWQHQQEFSPSPKSFHLPSYD